MLVTLATFHSERSELKMLACQNTAEDPKEREIERETKVLISDENKNLSKERERKKKRKQVVERELKRGN